MIVAGKAWGETRTLFAANNVEIHRIAVRAGGYCSKHRHAAKFNAFYVESGRLAVKAWKTEYDLIDETVLGPGQMTVVPPGEFHEFVAREDTVAFEIYWTTLDPHDIERETCGGVARPATG